MGRVIAVAGKGGTGKTTVAALLVRLLAEGDHGSVLAIDADPNSNLAEVLGADPGRSIGSILDGIAEDPSRVPGGMPKERYIEYEVQSGITEAGGFDLLTMGKPEGPGCYCYVNNVLRKVVAALIKDYDYIIIDNEAGLEHLSRRTTRSADVLLVVSDATPVGLKSAARIVELAAALKIEAGRNMIIINRFASCNGTAVRANLEKAFGGRRADLLGCLPQDAALAKASLQRAPVAGLSDRSAILKGVRRLKDKILSTTWPAAIKEKAGIRKAQE